MSTKKFIGILLVLSILTSGLAIFAFSVVFGINPFESLFGMNLKEINTAIKNENYDEAERLYIEKLKSNYDIELVTGLTEVRETKAIKEDLKQIDKLVEEENIYKALTVTKEMKINNRVESLDSEIEQKYEELKDRNIKELKTEVEQEIKEKKFKGEEYNLGNSYSLGILYTDYATNPGVKELIKKYIDEEKKFIKENEVAEANRIAEKRREEEARLAEEEQKIEANKRLAYEKAEKKARSVASRWIFKGGNSNIINHTFEDQDTKVTLPCYDFYFYDPVNNTDHAIRIVIRNNSHINLY